MAVKFSPEVANQISPAGFGAASGYEGTVVSASAFGGRPLRLGITPGRGAAWFDRRQQFGVLALTIAGVFDVHDHGVVKQPVQQGRGNDGIPEHLALGRINGVASIRPGTRLHLCTDLRQ